MRPTILISNDDGIHAMGMMVLADIVREIGDVVIVAPDRGRSGSALSITTTIPVRFRELHKEEGFEVYSCTGTPCDCIKMALEKILPQKPDIILGGINHGDNAAVNAHYSGTMAICIEGTMKDIPSIGFSNCAFKEEEEFYRLAPHIRHIVEKVIDKGLPRQTYLNVNFPDVSEFKGIRICTMGLGDWIDEWVECEDPRGRRYFWMAGSYESYNADDERTDTWALNNGYIAVTPITLDNTAYDAMGFLKEALSMKNEE